MHTSLSRHAERDAEELEELRRQRTLLRQRLGGMVVQVEAPGRTFTMEVLPSDTVKEVIGRVAVEEAQPGFEVLLAPPPGAPPGAPGASSGRLLEEGSTLRHLGIQGHATLRWCYSVHFIRALNKFGLQLA